jgi:cell division protein DivIC
VLQGMKFIQSIPAWAKNKYLVTGICFLVWMVFFDLKDMGTGFGKEARYKELQQSEQHLADQIKATKLELGQLKNSAQTIERYAREKYLMKKDNEDLFIVADEKTAQ